MYVGNFMRWTQIEGQLVLLRLVSGSWWVAVVSDEWLSSIMYYGLMYVTTAVMIRFNGLGVYVRMKYYRSGYYFGRWAHYITLFLDSICTYLFRLNLCILSCFIGSLHCVTITTYTLLIIHGAYIFSHSPLFQVPQTGRLHGLGLGAHEDENQRWLILGALVGFSVNQIIRCFK